MTAFAGAESLSDGMAVLNALLRGELAAVNAWQHALRSAESRRTVHVPEILRIASEHLRTVAALRVVVRQMGGDPAREAETAGAFGLLTESVTVRELLEGEKSGLAIYEATDGTLEGDAWDLVALELIPRHRRLVAEVAELLARLAQKPYPLGGDERPGDRVTG